MKLFTNAILMLTVLAFTVSGCKKDDGPANYLQVGDTTIALSDGNVKFYGSYSPTTYNFDLDFVSPEIVLSTDESGNPVYTGIGTRIYFETYSKESAAPGDGKYTFLDDGNYTEFTYDYSYYSFNYDWNGGSWASTYIESGDLTVKKTSGGYIVDFKGTDENGVAVKLHYKGALTYYDRSSSKK